ncbi:MAG TPA: DegQ family serine endoprotease [Bryobacteraceae bacterium]|nr:DegQ family serine endoprotease [Bryobacteraceae bacterium]
MNISRFLHEYKRKGLIALGVVTLTGGLVAVGFGYSTSRISLKLADANEGPSRITMAPAARAAMPSVVKISSSKVVRQPAGLNGQGMDPLFRQFFGDQGGFQAPRSHREGGLGSGVIISPDGYILTNNHVVDGATDVSVTMPDRREFKARVIGTDKRTDVALIKIEASNLPAITIGNSSRLQVGDAVLAIGNPYGVGQTVTMGIVSAVGRSNLGIEDYEDFIQTDAPINPGNSGGALVNDRGELIGINTAILAQESGGNQGIGFAVPINLARDVMDQIETHGHVTRSYLGVTIQEVTPSLAKDLGLSGVDGALVSDVSPNSPAQRAGIETGDVILAINGTPISQQNELRMKVSMMSPDQNVRLKISRNGQTREVTVRLAEMPGETLAKAGTGNENATDASLQGVSVQDLDAQTARQLGLPPSTKGVVVTDVDPASSAAAAGLHEGDVIQQVNRQPVTNSDEFAHAVKRSNSGESLLLVNRQGNKMFLSV